VCFQAGCVHFEKLTQSVAGSTWLTDLLTERKSAACDHDRYAHADGRVGVESGRRSYKHHDESCSNDSEIVQDISKDMDDDSIDSQVRMCMLFRWILLLKSAHHCTSMNSNVTYKI
jgi:hypothetical protein